MIEFRVAGGRWVAVLVVGVLVSACGAKEADQISKTVAPSVSVVTVHAQPFMQSSNLPGRIEPVRVAEVRARVAGIVLDRHFEEGADVTAGQVLFQIDPAPFQAALARAQGELAKVEAAIFETGSLVQRYKPLVAIDAVSRQEFDAAQSALKSAQAARMSAQADVQTAQLNLDYATVKAPITGRIGRALVTEGALVGQGEATPMATIQQLSPVYVDFKQPVADMVRMQAALGHQLSEQEGASVPLTVTIEGTDQKSEGHLLFSDITVDRSTGQVSLRGQFDNADGLLLPGMYVRVHTQDHIDPQAILVPQRAVQRSSDGAAQVLVVDQKNVAKIRKVRTGAMQGSNWHITEGLLVGDQVIVGGAAQPDETVRIAKSSEESAVEGDTASFESTVVAKGRR